LEKDWTGAFALRNVDAPVDNPSGAADNQNLNEIPLATAHLCFSSLGLRRVAVFFILAIHGSTSVW
jgi:hypothetical protein